MVTLPNKVQISNLLNLQKEIKTIDDINKIFFNYRSYFFDKISKYYSKEGEAFINIFPFLLDLVSEYDILFSKKEIPILKTGETNCYILTRKQVALIFFLSFLGLIAPRTDYDMNYFNVARILLLNDEPAVQFGRCFLNYLIVIGNWYRDKNIYLEEKIIYKRENKPDFNYLKNEKNLPLCELKLENKGSLFDGEASYCVDFANKYIGGGVLTGGCVQEEILFAVEPEATISMLFMEIMDNNDAIGIFNTIQYSDYKGYGDSFNFKGNLIDGKSEPKKHKIIAIDASDLRIFNFNYFYNNRISEEEINRDIHKAYVGFNLINNDNEQNKKIIATGNWGCGAFNGNHELKFLQQWIAASYAKVERLDYYTFGDIKMKIVEENYKKIKDKFKNVKDLYDALISISKINDNYIKNILSI